MKVTARAWRDGASVDVPSSLTGVPDLLADPQLLTWIDILDPTAEDLAPLAERLSLDPLAIEDALTVHERPKAVRYDETTFVALYTLDGDDGWARLSMFALQGGLVTIRLGEGLDTVDVARAISDNGDLHKYGAKALELTVLDVVVDGYTTRVTAVDERVDDLESILFENHMGRRIATETFGLHKQVGAMRRMVVPVRDIASSLVRHVAADEDLRAMLPFAEDVYDHTMRAADWVEGLRDGVESVRSTNLALMDNQMNIVMKKLTGWAAIIAVPTLITGYFGQNIPYPGDGRPIGFWMSTIAIVVSAVALYALFKARDWL